MKRILEIGVYKPGSLRLEIANLSDVEETVNKNTAVFVGSMTVMSRITGQNFRSSYRVSRAYLRRHSQWRMVASQRAHLAGTEVKVANHI